MTQNNSNKKNKKNVEVHKCEEKNMMFNVYMTTNQANDMS